MNNLELIAYTIGASGLVIIAFLWLQLLIDHKKQMKEFYEKLK